MPTSYTPIDGDNARSINHPPTTGEQKTNKVTAIEHLHAAKKLADGDTLEAKVVRVKPVHTESTGTLIKPQEQQTQHPQQPPTRQPTNQAALSQLLHSQAPTHSHYQVMLKIGEALVTVFTETPLEKNDIIKLLVQNDQQLRLVKVISHSLQRDIQPILQTAISQQSSISPIIAHLLALEGKPLSHIAVPPAQIITPKLAADLLIELPKLLQQLSQVVPTVSTLLAPNKAIQHLSDALLKQVLPLSEHTNTNTNTNTKATPTLQPLSDTDRKALNILLRTSIKTSLETTQQQARAILAGTPASAQQENTPKASIAHTIRAALSTLLNQSGSKPNSEATTEDSIIRQIAEHNKLSPSKAPTHRINPESVAISNNAAYTKRADQAHSLDDSLIQLRMTTAKLGQLLEHHISQAAGPKAQQLFNSETVHQFLGQDLKAILLKLQALFQRLNVASTDKTVDAKHTTPELAQLRAVYALTLYQNRLSTSTFSALNTTPSPTPSSILSIFSSVPPPLTGITFFTRQPPINIQLSALKDFSKYSAEMAESMQKALSRITLTQWQNLQNWTLNRESATPRRYSFEIPVQDQQQVHTIQCEIEKRAVSPDPQETTQQHPNNKRISVWRIALNFDIEPLGPLFLQLSLQTVHTSDRPLPFPATQGETVKATAQIWAERAATVDQTEAHLKTFKDMLMTIGLEVESLECYQGEPPKEKAGAEQNYIDIKT